MLVFLRYSEGSITLNLNFKLQVRLLTIKSLNIEKESQCRILHGNAVNRAVLFY
jgi:hypothetical protein